MIGLPSMVVCALPWAVSADLAMFGYGIGTGPAGVGVLHTSGKAMAMPSLDLWTTVIMFTLIVAGMSGTPCYTFAPTTAGGWVIQKAARSPLSALVHSKTRPHFQSPRVKPT